MSQGHANWDHRCTALRKGPVQHHSTANHMKARWVVKAAISQNHHGASTQSKNKISKFELQNKEYTLFHSFYNGNFCITESARRNFNLWFDNEAMEWILDNFHLISLSKSWQCTKVEPSRDLTLKCGVNKRGEFVRITEFRKEGRTSIFIPMKGFTFFHRKLDKFFGKSKAMQAPAPEVNKGDNLEPSVFQEAEQVGVESEPPKAELEPLKVEEIHEPKGQIAQGICGTLVESTSKIREDCILSGEVDNSSFHHDDLVSLENIVQDKTLAIEFSKELSTPQFIVEEDSEENDCWDTFEGDLSRSNYLDGDFVGTQERRVTRSVTITKALLLEKQEREGLTKEEEGWLKLFMPSSSTLNLVLENHPCSKQKRKSKGKNKKRQ